VQGVPCFILERKYVVSGAQSPEVFQQVFEMIAREKRGEPAAAAN